MSEFNPRQEKKMSQSYPDINNNTIIINEISMPKSTHFSTLFHPNQSSSDSPEQKPLVGILKNNQIQCQPLNFESPPKPLTIPEKFIYYQDDSNYSGCSTDDGGRLESPRSSNLSTARDRSRQRVEHNEEEEGGEETQVEKRKRRSRKKKNYFKKRMTIKSEETKGKKKTRKSKETPSDQILTLENGVFTNSFRLNKEAEENNLVNSLFNPILAYKILQYPPGEREKLAHFYEECGDESESEEFHKNLAIIQKLAEISKDKETAKSFEQQMKAQNLQKFQEDINNNNSEIAAEEENKRKSLIAAEVRSTRGKERGSFVPDLKKAREDIVMKRIREKEVQEGQKKEQIDRMINAREKFKKLKIREPKPVVSICSSDRTLRDDDERAGSRDTLKSKPSPNRNYPKPWLQKPKTPVFNDKVEESSRIKQEVSIRPQAQDQISFVEERPRRNRVITLDLAKLGDDDENDEEEKYFQTEDEDDFNASESISEKTSSPVLAMRSSQTSKMSSNPDENYDEEDEQIQNVDVYEIASTGDEEEEEGNTLVSRAKAEIKRITSINSEEIQPQPEILFMASPPAPILQNQNESPFSKKKGKGPKQNGDFKRFPSPPVIAASQEVIKQPRRTCKTEVQVTPKASEGYGFSEAKPIISESPLKILSQKSSIYNRIVKEKSRHSKSKAKPKSRDAKKVSSGGDGGIGKSGRISKRGSNLDNKKVMNEEKKKYFSEESKTIYQRRVTEHIPHKYRLIEKESKTSGKIEPGEEVCKIIKAKQNGKPTRKRRNEVVEGKVNVNDDNSPREFPPGNVNYPVFGKVNQRRPDFGQFFGSNHPRNFRPPNIANIMNEGPSRRFQPVTIPAVQPNKFHFLEEEPRRMYIRPHPEIVPGGGGFFYNNNPNTYFMSEAGASTGYYPPGPGAAHCPVIAPPPFGNFSLVRPPFTQAQQQEQQPGYPNCFRIPSDGRFGGSQNFYIRVENNPQSFNNLNQQAKFQNENNFQGRPTWSQQRDPNLPIDKRSLFCFHGADNKDTKLTPFETYPSRQPSSLGLPSNFSENFQPASFLPEISSKQNSHHSFYSDKAISARMSSMSTLPQALSGSHFGYSNENSCFSFSEIAPRPFDESMREGLKHKLTEIFKIASLKADDKARPEEINSVSTIFDENENRNPPPPPSTISSDSSQASVKVQISCNSLWPPEINGKCNCKLCTKLTVRRSQSLQGIQDEMPNYIVKNIRELKRYQRPAPLVPYKFVDDAKGNKKSPLFSLLGRPGYGRVPQYIKKRQDELDSARLNVLIEEYRMAHSKLMMENRKWLRMCDARRKAAQNAAKLIEWQHLKMQGNFSSSGRRGENIFIAPYYDEQMHVPAPPQPLLALQQQQQQQQNLNPPGPPQEFETETEEFQARKEKSKKDKKKKNLKKINSASSALSQKVTLLQEISEKKKPEHGEPGEEKEIVESEGHEDLDESQLVEFFHKCPEYFLRGGVTSAPGVMESEEDAEAEAEDVNKNDSLEPTFDDKNDDNGNYAKYQAFLQDLKLNDLSQEKILLKSLSMHDLL